jgi:phosphoribosylanthranilate isomerase
MSLRTPVKVSKISNLSDARYCAGMGVEMLGFRMIQGQEDYIAPALFQDIRGWISGPKIIAELYGISAIEEIELIVQTYAPDLFELHFSDYHTFRDALSLPCIVKVPHDYLSTITIKNNDPKIAFILADETTGCKDLGLHYPTLIQISSLEKLHEKLSENCFKGIVLEASKESRPGITNYDVLGEILEALDVD